MNPLKAVSSEAGLFLLLCCIEILLPIFAVESPLNSLVFWSLLGISLFYAIKLLYLVRYHSFIKWVYILLFMFVVYGILYYLYGPIYISPASGERMHKLSYTTTILKSLSPLFPIYYYSKRGKITSEFIQIWIIPLFVVAVIFYFDQMQAAMLRHLMDDSVTNNGGYYIASLIPFAMFLSQKRLIQYVYLLTCLIFVIYSMKRGATVFAGLMLLVYFNNSLLGISIKKKLGFLVSFSVLLFGLYYFISEYMMENLYFLERIQDTLDGDTSGRDSLYDDFWEYFLYRATPLQQLLGGGANYNLTVSNNYAHNDWIEILVNQGILGIFVFFMYWKSFFRTAFRTNLDKTCSIVIKMIFIGYFAKTMFSMSYTDYNIMVNLCLGYCISRIDTTKSLTI